MSSNRFSKLLIAAVLLVLAAGAAGAVTVNDDRAPEDAAAATDVRATFTLESLFKDPSLEQWTLVGTTELTEVTWTVTSFDQAGNRLAQESSDGQRFEQAVTIENDVAEVRVRVVGTAPEVANWSYDPEQTFLLAEFQQTRRGGTSSVLATYETHHFTEDSREARGAIDDAQAAISNAGGNRQAEETLDNAISAYEAGNFGNALDLANRAEETARSAQQRSQQTTLILYGVVGLIVIGVIVGAVYWYRSNQTASKL